MKQKPFATLTVTVAVAVPLVLLFLVFGGARLREDDTKQEHPSDTEAATAATIPNSLHDHYDALYTALTEAMTALQTDAYSDHAALRAEIAALRAELDRLRGETEKSPAETVRETAADSPPETAGDTVPLDPATHLTYTVRDGCATVTGCRADGASGDVLVIPSTLGGARVTAIADEAFAGCPFRAVVLPATLERIGYLAFTTSPALETVTIPATVTRIDYDAFAHCPRLTIYCPAASYAEAYARSHALPVVAC